MGNQIPLFFSFNTQPPEGGWLLLAGSLELGEVSTHSRPKAAGFFKSVKNAPSVLFQHTAARRRLDDVFAVLGHVGSFNTQPPEGGWADAPTLQPHSDGFNTQPPEGGWAPTDPTQFVPAWFQHTAARRRLGVRYCCTLSRFSVSTHSRPKAAGINDFFLLIAKKFQHTAARRRLVYPAIPRILP